VELPVVVNEAFVSARDLEAPLGRQIEIAGRSPDARTTATIIGVVRDQGVTPYARGRPSPGVYVPFRGERRQFHLLLEPRASLSLPRIWQEALLDIDPYLPVGQVRGLEQALRAENPGGRLLMFVFLSVGAATLLIAVVGLYGVHSFFLTRQTRDLGVRRALGAGRAAILGRSFVKGLVPVVLGLLIGIVPGFLGGRLLVTTSPPTWVLVVAPTVLLLASVVALARPTLKAMSVDLMVVLREE